jgi:ABC-type multidrug transport system ATPase subunit
VIVTVENVHMLFTSRSVLREVNFELFAGEVVGLLGPNGAGKTTLIKLISGLLVPTKGKITILGEPIHPRVIRSEVALVQEGRPSLYEYMTPMENLLYFGHLLNLKKPLQASVRQVLEATGLTEVANEPLLYLSLGTKRRVGLALAYLKGARLLLLDEPSASLDMQSLARMRTSLRNFAAAGNTVLLTGHEMGFLESVCDRFIFLANGTVTAEGTLQSLAKRFHIRRYAEVWLEGRPSVGEIVEEVEGVLKVRLPVEAMVKLTNVTIREVHIENSLLEAVFQETTRVAG